MSIDLEDVPAELEPAVLATLDATGTGECHLAVVLVDRDRIRELNREHRDRDSATDVLSFPVDPDRDSPGPRELGDVIVCEAECEDLAEAVGMSASSLWRRVKALEEAGVIAGSFRDGRTP